MSVRLPGVLFWGALFLALLNVIAPAAEPLHAAFVGIWDRSLPIVDSACREAGVTAAYFRSPEFAHPKEGDDAAKYDMVFVLNLEAGDAPRIAERLKEVKKKNPQQHIFALDTRGSQADLQKAGLLEPDQKIIDYWRPNGAVNIRRLIHYCLVQYFHGPGPAEPPVLIPEAGYYDPDREESFDTIASYKEFKASRQRWKEGAPVAVLIIQQSFWVTHDLKVADAEVRALEKEGLNTVVVFGDREEKIVALLRAAKPTVLIEDRHGAMWESNALLKELDAPYLRPISMLASTNEEWLRDPRGMSNRDIGLFMSLQESWGTIEPVVVGGLLASIQGFRLHEPIPDRIDTFAARAAKWAALRQKQNGEKKIAFIYYNKSLGQDDLMRGSPTGGFLDGPESLTRFLPELQKAGYKLSNVPGTSAALIDAIRKAGRNIGPWAQGDLEKMADEGNPVLIPLSKYRQWFQEKLGAENQKAVIEKFGEPPGRIMVVTRNGEPQIVLPRIELGNIILTPQPERGEKQDSTLLHSRDVPPPHNYLAFYWWLQEQYKADAIVHWGTHGSLELLPGKEAGLSKDSWSDICAGHLPVIDLWITDNLGEATLARRRSYAELVDHMVPPTMSAGLNDQFKALHEDIHKLRTLEEGLLKEEFRKRITEQATKEKLKDAAKPENPEGPLSDAAIARLDAHLHNLYESTTPQRLHVFGEPPSAAETMPYLTRILGKPFLDHLAVSENSVQHLFDNKQERRDAAARFLGAALEGKPPVEIPFSHDLEKDVAFARDMRDRLQKSGTAEVAGLIHALAGGYVEAGPGPDPVRNPSSVPTGRNLYSLNPEEIPNRAAWDVARQLVDDLLRTKHPKKIAMDLNGMNTMRDFGVMEGQILYLLGVEPIWNQNNLVIDVKLIPAEELKRPRVDVFIAMGGQYKENFPSRVALLDKAVRMAAAAPEANNPVRDGVASVESRLLQRGFSSARASQFAVARIFGTKPGNMSGTNILYLVPRSGVWDKDDDIASVYMDSMSYVYSGDTWGEKVDGLYEEALQGTDTILRIWASNMTSQLSNHHAYEYLGGLNMAVRKVTGKTPQAFIADVRDPSGAKMRDFEEVLATSFRSELLNKHWIEGMKSHDYAGAGQISELVKNTFGWSVVRPESVTQTTWNEVYDVYVKDSYQLRLAEWFERVSPHAMQEMTATLLEAARKGMWKASPEQVSTLAHLYAESVKRHGDSGGLVSGGNTRLMDYAARTLGVGGKPEDAQLAEAMKRSIESSTAAAAAANKVTGPKLESAAATPKPADNPPPPQRETAAKSFTPKPSFPIWELAAAVVVVLLIGAGFVRKSGSL
ncbi:cobaltochelatase CobN subunit [Chthoniobacter flavus]|nr:cobaltochelatase subunit CobN [Chthoniobacter flavus]TCO92892.1 cobaltochelatase CobN subunit [Chthoniobacter flavus]